MATKRQNKSPSRVIEGDGENVNNNINNIDILPSNNNVVNDDKIHLIETVKSGNVKKLIIETRPVNERKKNKPQIEQYIGQLVEHNNCYCIMKEQKEDGKKTGLLYPKAITNFTLQAVKTIKDDDGTKSEFNIILNTGKTYKNIIIYNKKLAVLNDFKKEIKQVDKNLKIDEALDEILIFISDKNEKTVLGTHKTGFISDYFVTTKKSYDVGLKETQNIIYSNQNEYITTDIMKARQLNKTEFNELMKPLFNYNNEYKAIIIISFITSCFIKQKLFDNGFKIPILSINGESGSGKSTTLENVVQAIFCTDKAISASMGTTKFTLLKNANSSNFIPMTLDEYKPTKMKETQINMLSDFLRSTYDNHETERGQSDQRVQVFTLTAPLIIIGENQTNENALKERIITLDFLKKDLTKENTEHMEFLAKNKKLLNNLGYTMLKYFMGLKNVDSSKIYEYKEKLTNVSISRLNTSYAILVYCYSLFYEMAQKYGLKLLYSISDVINIFNNNYRDSADEKSELIQTIELIDLMATNKAIGLEFDYKLDIENDELYLNLPQIYLKLNKFIQDYKKTDSNHLSQKTFAKSLRGEKFFINYKPVKFKGKLAKCYVIDLKKLSEQNIELTSFQSKNSIMDLKILGFEK